jgi:hypothetical protein
MTQHEFMAEVIQIDPSNPLFDLLTMVASGMSREELAVYYPEPEGDE